MRRGLFLSLLQVAVLSRFYLFGAAVSRRAQDMLIENIICLPKSVDFPCRYTQICTRIGGIKDHLPPEPSEWRDVLNFELPFEPSRPEETA